MSYCLRLSCQRPHNPSKTTFCQHCGARLLLGDRYRAVQLIKYGQTTRTFLGIDTQKLINKRCIIKAFELQDQANDIRQDIEQLEQIRRHPRIPTLLAYFECDSVLYGIQEFVDGPTLEQELAKLGAFTEEQIWPVLAEGLEILQILHTRDIIHRNIKPANFIRRTSDQRLVLVNIGTAKYTTLETPVNTETLVGSAEYAPLEQLLGRTVFASDLYSLGVTCAHLITGLSPFELFNPVDGTWVWRSVSGPVSSSLATILNRLLARNVANRYQSVDDVLADAGDHLSIPSLSSSSQSRKAANNQPLSEPLAQSTESSIRPQWVCRQTITHENGFNAFSLTPNGQILITGGNDGEIRLWDVGSEQCVYQLAEHHNAISALATSPDGLILASSSWDQTLRLWHLETGKQTHVLSTHQPEVTSLAIAPSIPMNDATQHAEHYRLLSAGRNAIINLWQIENGNHVTEFRDHSSAIEAMAASPHYPIVATGDASGIVHIWHIGTQERLRTLSRHEASITAIALSVIREIIATGSADTTIRLRHLNTGGLLHTLSGHQFPVSAIAMSPGGDYLATGSYDGVVKLWCLKTGDCIQTLTHNTKPIVAIAFDHVNDTFVSGSRDGILHIWQVLS
ncbi:MAG: serine/threonine-protein kinase [Cyanobacteria bacterium P01_E01_bin.6]